ncbi:hypothetical protein KTAU_18790 [Thermogemmatispora aurantia]|uniref:Uncharacterized protein n=1 Tax=Thermogemmatispora aurantia TaxID=2045279 RepID=A0A5J4K842_9CHLR|nr:hypothetical protein KTAU_18790 [Thermogemmatispora aurantia]
MLVQAPCNYIIRPQAVSHLRIASRLKLDMEEARAPVDPNTTQLIGAQLQTLHLTREARLLLALADQFHPSTEPGQHIPIY